MKGDPTSRSLASLTSVFLNYRAYLLRAISPEPGHLTRAVTSPRMSLQVSSRSSSAVSFYEKATARPIRRGLQEKVRRIPFHHRFSLGTDYGEFQVAGTASLSGTLVVTIASDFALEPEGETFALVRAGILSGTFDQIEVNGARNATVNYGATSATVTVTR